MTETSKVDVDGESTAQRLKRKREAFYKRKDGEDTSLGNVKRRKSDKNSFKADSVICVTIG